MIIDALSDIDINTTSSENDDDDGNSDAIKITAFTAIALAAFLLIFIMV